jgi:aldose 1-epimerase
MIIEQNEQQISLVNPRNQARVEINLGAGGLLTRYDVEVGKELLNIVKLPFSDRYPLESNPYHPSAWLSPWVNRVRNGNYSFEGRNYQLAINEPDLGNAIHGLVARTSFILTASKATENEASIRISHVNEGAVKGYPFPFEFSIEYTFEKNGGLRVNFHAKNTGSTNMPFACGWHPYFGFPDTLLDKLEVKFASKSRFLSDAQMIPMREEAFDRSEPIALATEKPDHVFRLKPMEKHVTELYDNKREISLYLEQSSIEFPFLVVFAIEDQNAVAIEPMTANTDAYNTGDGLLVLTPDAQFDAEVYLWVGKGSKSVR